MTHRNNSFEFLLYPSPLNGTQFHLAKAKYTFLKLDKTYPRPDKRNRDRYISKGDNGQELELLVTRFEVQFFPNCSENIRKTVYILYKAKKVQYLLKIHTPFYASLNNIYCIEFFVNKISENELRMMLEVALPEKLGMNLIGI